MFYADKKYANVEKICKEVMDLPEDDNVQGLKIVAGEILIEAISKQGRTDEAIKMIDEKIKEEPSNWKLLRFKGLIEYQAGREEEAAKNLEEVLKRIKEDKDLPEKEKAKSEEAVRYRLSGVYVDLNQVDKSAEQLKILLKHNPDSPTLNNDLGFIWADHDMNLEEAEKMIHKAIEEDRKLSTKENPDAKPEDIKDNPAYLDSLGWVLFKEKKYKEAKPYLIEAAKDKDSQSVEIYDHLGDLHMALGEKAEAIAAWKKGMEVAGPQKRDQRRKDQVEKKLKTAEK